MIRNGYESFQIYYRASAWQSNSLVYLTSKKQLLYYKFANSGEVVPGAGLGPGSSGLIEQGAGLGVIACYAAGKGTVVEGTGRGLAG